MRTPRDVPVALLLCLAGLVGLGGLHRFYLGKRVSGTIYLCTLGLFFVGTVIDLFHLRNMVDDCNDYAPR
jgi:TM2 domain-containing membrane protein YozV